MTVADWPHAQRSLDAYDLTGKRALVVGAAHPVGQSIALALAEASCTLALCDSTAPDSVMAVRKLARQLRDQGGNAIEQSTDVSSGQGAQVMVSQVAKELGGIDILVNVAASFHAEPATRTTDADWAKVIGQNLNATFFACRAVGKLMLKSEGTGRSRGRIINVASALGDRGMANASAFCAAQAGILNLTRALAQEWAAQGITVNAIALGWMDGDPALAGGSPQADQTVRYIPMKRTGQADEVAPLAVYLASDASGYVTGQVLYVDGGLSVHL